jgi:hypothetical protein
MRKLPDVVGELDNTAASQASSVFGSLKYRRMNHPSVSGWYDCSIDPEAWSNLKGTGDL